MELLLIVARRQRIVPREECCTVQKEFSIRGLKSKCKLQSPVLANCKDGTIRAVVVLANQEAPYI